MKNIKSLQDERGQLWEQMRDLVKQAKNEERDLSSEEETRLDQMMKDHGDIDKKIERQAKLDQIMAAKAEERAEEAEQARAATPEEKEKEYNRVFWKFHKKGSRLLTQKERDMMADSQMRAQTTITDAAGGYMIPQGFSNDLHVEMALWGGMLDICTVVDTESGNPIEWPTVDDTGNTGALLSETSQVTEQDITVAQKMLNAWTYTSKLIRVQNQLLQDSYFDLPSFLRQAFARRLGTAQNAHLTTGDGSSKPNGFVTASSVGKTTASNSTVTGAELTDLIHSVNRVYRRNARFVLNDASLAIIKKLVIGTSGADNRPLWTQSLVPGEPNTILGYAYTINEDMADFGAGAKPIGFGDFSYYLVRRAGGIVMRRLDERYADYNQTGFVAFERIDGEQLSTNAIKVLRNPTT